MGALPKISIPTEILTFVNANVQGDFLVTIYVQERDIDFQNHLKQKLRRNFTYFSFRYWAKELISTENSKLISVKFQKSYPRPELVPISGTFFVVHDFKQKLYFLIVPGSVDFLKRGVHAFMEVYFYNRISRVYLTSREIFKILTRVENRLKKPIFSGWCTGKRLFSEKSHTIVQWEDKPIPFRDCFSQAEEDHLSINWIRASTDPRKKGGKIRMDISREGHVASNLNNITLVLDALGVAVSKGNADLKLLKDKEITSERQPTPIMMTYRKDILTDNQTKEKLIGQINKYDRCTYSVIHGGNPHIYMYVRDSIDFSSFSLRTIGPRKILIIPQLRSTYAALSRFIHFLDENFTEHEEINEIKT